MTAPAWLGDAADIRALLHAVLDRFDKQAGEARARNIFLPFERFVPTLARNDDAADQAWELIQDLARQGVLEIRFGRRSSFDSPWVGAKAAFSPACESVVREWLQRPATPNAMRQWREAVSRHAHAFGDRGDLLGARRIAIADRTADEVVAALASLAAVSRPATLRQLSAFAFWGDSKVLDDRGEMIAALFPQLVVRERAVIVSVYLPAVVRGILFIENQDTYVASMHQRFPGVAEHALVYVSGFRGAAERIRSNTGVEIHCCGPGRMEHDAGFREWWFDTQRRVWPLHFWGDLDFAGMQILKALRSRFDGVDAWRPGYEPMIRAATRGLAHSRGTDTGQTDPIEVGCDYADQVLLPAIRAHGFCDQECIELLGV